MHVSDPIGSDKLGQVVNTDTDERRERKWGPQLPALLTRPGTVYLYDLSPRE